MKILAFETSCDDTAVAVVEDGVKVLSSVRVSQVEHEAWGGVVPELAARLHADNWRGAFEQALKEANLEMSDIDYLAVTQGPGLQTSLLTGTTAASFLSQAYDIPLIPVHHIYGHMCSVFLDRELEADSFFSALVLTVSGGHTQMHEWTDFTDLEMLGTTLDDACGEAFDKVAKMLGLGYPGGPIVSKEALKGDRMKYDLPKIYLAKHSLDFSFSGLKAAVYRLLETTEDITDPQFIADVCASFEYACGKIFARKVERALDRCPGIKTVVFVGGVSANTYITKTLTDLLSIRGIEFLTPAKLAYSTDNAAMIGAAAYRLIQKDPSCARVQFLDAQSRMKF